MRWSKRLLALLLSLAAVALFYVFAVMMEDKENRPSNQFIVEAARAPLERMDSLQSQDGRLLAERFGVPLPLPAGFLGGEVRDLTWHAYLARTVTLRGESATVTGIRPAAAAPAILPGKAVFLASDKALLGYPLTQADTGNGMVYALVTPEAAFLIVPNTASGPGEFALMEPGP